MEQPKQTQTTESNSEMTAPDEAAVVIIGTPEHGAARWQARAREAVERLGGSSLAGATGEQADTPQPARFGEPFAEPQHGVPPVINTPGGTAAPASPSPTQGVNVIGPIPKA